MIRGRRKALVAEDNLVSQKILAGLLTRLGYQVDVVADGQAALRVLAQRAYDVILMDCQMPTVNGREATIAIRVREVDGALQHTPIVAVTAHSEAFSEEDCRNAGMDGYLLKPVTLDTLRVALEDSLEAGLPSRVGSDEAEYRPSIAAQG